MTIRSPDWFNAQYDNRARIPEHPAILDEWAQGSAAALARHPEMQEHAFGDHPRERLDVFPARQAGSPVFVYLHGGYWRALDKRDHSFIAAPYVDAGAMVVLPDYALCPEVDIETIVMQTVQALAWTWRHAREHGGDPDRIVVAGHSAGGHLATMLLACRWTEVAPDLPEDLVKAALSVSGIYELEPLRHAPFLAPDLGLTRASALKLSPAAMPAPHGRLVSVVGADESEEFLRQARLIRERWGETVSASLVVAGRNHMSVLGTLAEAGSGTMREALRLLHATGKGG